MRKTGVEAVVASLQISSARSIIGRSVSLSFEVSRYESMGIRLVTRADEFYPARLKKKLKNSCPPIFYCAGNLELLAKPAVGYVGSRSIELEDTKFTIETVQKTLDRGFSVVTGGAKGVDTAAEAEAIELGGCAVVYLADSLMKRIRKRAVLDAIQEGRMVLLSAVKPDMGFQVKLAMARNRLIYSQSSGTVVVRSDLNKGGTWAGATECLRYQWCPVFCWDRAGYAGNAALIEKGAIPIDASWDGDVQNVPVPRAEESKETVGEQITMFERTN